MNSLEAILTAYDLWCRDTQNSKILHIFINSKGRVVLEQYDELVFYIKNTPPGLQQINLRALREKDAAFIDYCFTAGDVGAAALYILQS